MVVPEGGGVRPAGVLTRILADDDPVAVRH